jgi:DNA-binding YbaB/EbfC family protein
MFGNLGQIASLLKNSGKIQESMKQMQERLAAARFVGEAGGGQVQATVDGKGDLISIKIERNLVNSGDVELLEDLVTAAVRSAISISRTGMQSEIANVGGSLGFPALGDMLEKFR